MTTKDEPVDTKPVETQTILHYLSTPALLARLSSEGVRFLSPLESPEGEEQVASQAVAEVIRTCHFEHRDLTPLPVEITGLESTTFAGRSADYIRLSDEYGLLVLKPGQGTTAGTPAGFIQQLQRVAAGLPLGVLIKEVDRDFSYLSWNRRLERLYGIRSGDAVGRRDEEIFCKEAAGEARKEDLEALRRGGRPLFGKPRSCGCGGGERHVQYAKFLVEEGERRYIVGFVTDVTELVRSRGEIARANEWKSLMLSIVSHDVLAPLQSMVDGLDQLTEEPEPLDQEAKTAALSFLRAGAEKTCELVRDLLLWSSSPEDGSILEEEPFNVVDMVAGTVRRAEVAYSKAISLESAASVSATTSRRALETILRNIIGNACSHSGSGASVDVQLSDDRSYLTLRIFDTGPGMPQGYMDSLNEGRLPAELEPGTAGRRGIGLHLVLALSQRIGAKVTFRRRSTGGTEVELLLPKQPIRA